jgi:hypothetical protein
MGAGILRHAALLHTMQRLCARTRLPGSEQCLSRAPSPITLVVLWLATAESVPTVNVRWVSGVNDQQRFEAEQDLSLVWFEPKEPGTVRYFLMDANAENVQRIVAHPLIGRSASVRAPRALHRA